MGSKWWELSWELFFTLWPRPRFQVIIEQLFEQMGACVLYNCPVYYVRIRLWHYWGKYLGQIINCIHDSIVIDSNRHSDTLERRAELCFLYNDEVSWFYEHNKSGHCRCGEEVQWNEDLRSVLLVNMGLLIDVLLVFWVKQHLCEEWANIDISLLWYDRAAVQCQ